MSKVILNIAKTYSEGFLNEIEKNKYFQLHKNGATRTNIYSFAVACALIENKEPVPIQKTGLSSTFVRTEYLKDEDKALYASLFYDKVLKDDTEKIDEICNSDKTYEFIESYANSGFEVIKNWYEQIEEETLVYKLINYMDKEYENIKDEIKDFVG